MLYCTCSASAYKYIDMKIIFWICQFLLLYTMYRWVPMVSRENFSGEIGHMNITYVYTLRRKDQDPSVTHYNFSKISTIKWSPIWISPKFKRTKKKEVYNLTHKKSRRRPKNKKRLKCLWPICKLVKFKYTFK